MNNKGFAISGIIYTILIIFLILIIGILSLFNSRKNVLDNLKNKVLGEVNTSTTITYDPFTTTGEVIEFVAKAKGYYEFNLYSPNLASSKGSQVKGEIYLSKGETLYFLIGSSNYNNGYTEIRTVKNDGSTAIMKASNSSFVADFYNGKVFSNIMIKNQALSNSEGKIIVNYLNKERLNSDLNKVKYIKDCINGSNADSVNSWSEIRALVDGDNKALDKKVTNLSGNISYSLITDGSNDTFDSSNETGEQCVIVDLERTYNLDSIQILHNKNKTFYGSKTYVSDDGINYTLIKNEETYEGTTGISISAYEVEQVDLVGNIYVPVKEFDDAVWLRLFHHNNLAGTELWKAVSQSASEEGYDVLHRQSVLSYLNNYKGKNGFEFLLEYSNLSGYNRWIQSTNPLETEKKSSMTKVPGYEAISISWNYYNWGGLAKSNSGKALLDGSIDSSNLFYAIGSTTSWNGGIPGPNQAITGSVDLWVRVDNLK